MNKKRIAQRRHRVTSRQRFSVSVSSILCVRICCLLACTTAIAAPADVITVTNTNDSGPGSLRQALADVHDGDTINFAVIGAISLTSGELLITRSVTISGPGANLLAIMREPNSASFRIFHVTPNHAVTIEGLAVINGSILNGFGGGILNQEGTLIINGCAVSGNSALGQQGLGGGIFSNGSGGGGFASLTITDSALSGNVAANGGAIFNDGASGMAILTINNSTLSSNSFAGIFSDGTATITITRSTLNDNPVASISILAGTLSIGNTILNAAASGVNLNIGKPATVTSQGYNVSSDDGGGFLVGPGDQLNTEPMLGPLQDNGGPTFTHELLKNSPAIDAGDPNFTPPPFYDQRGPVFWRVRNERIDVGSFEVQAGATPTPTPTTTATPTATLPPSPTPTSTVIPCHVTNTGPACGSVVTGPPPADFIISLSDPVDTATFQSTDFTVNSIPGDGFLLQNGNLTIVFHFNNTPVTPGLNTMHIPAGAFDCGNGPVAEFTCTFTYQGSTPTPTSTPTSTPRSNPSPRPRPNPQPRP